MIRKCLFLLGVVFVSLSVAAGPVLEPIVSPVVQETQQSREFFAAARVSYGLPEYADYRTSLVTNIDLSHAQSNDVPSGVSFVWSGSTKAPFVLEISDRNDFRGTDTRKERVDGMRTTLFNFRADTKYWWRVTDACGSCSKTETFTTAYGIRQIRAGQLRNVRDIGGWTGLRQGLVYRGSAWRFETSKGEVGPSDETIKVYRDTLHIRTDLDLRANALPLKNGDVDVTRYGAQRIVCGVSSVTGDLFGISRNYARPLRVLTDPKNFPVYIHCAGGADRTGAVVFLIEALCGVSDVDKAIDFEETSHAVIFNMRYRSNRTNEKTFQYALAVDEFMKYEGATLNEKVAQYARTTLGLTDDEINAIRDNLKRRE